MASASGGHKSPVDARIVVYHFIKYTVLLLGFVLFVKFAVFDTVAIATDQMSPALIQGDRVILWRLSLLWPISRLRLPGRGKVVVVMHPLLLKKLACLRVAGLPGDSIVIGKGVLRITGSAGVSFGGSVPPAEALLPEFTPRDSMGPYRLPHPGDTIRLDSLSLRDFFFAAAMINQEQSEKKCVMKADLFIDGKSANNLPMMNFSLYKGTLDALPETFAYNWFFWDRLQEYWARTAAGKQCLLRLGLYKDNERISKYVIHGSYIFLLADDWRKGLDSRYFGPVRASLIKGKVVCVLWSIGRGSGSFPFLRTDRIMKIVK
jgi:signal peptidase I